MHSGATRPQANPTARSVAHPDSLHALRHFVMFVGNPRNGTTLVRSLVDAHPEALLSVEVDVAKWLHEEFDQVLGRITENRARFVRNPVWTGLNYRVFPPPPPPGDEGGEDAAIRVIGDKKAGWTADEIARDPTLLQRLTEWCPLPIRWIHCVRNPRDVIASMHRELGLHPEWAIAKWFRRERVAQMIANTAGPEQFHRVYLEDLIAEPERELRALLNFLDLAPTPGWLEACMKLLWKTPRQARDEIEWEPGIAARLNRRVEALEHMSRYRTAPPPRAAWRAPQPSADFSGLRRFLVFVGNGRSGSTLVRSLLDAHPGILLAVEFYATEFLHLDFEEVLAGIAENQAAFARDPRWTGKSYSYRMELPPGGEAKLSVIGDKRSGLTTDDFLADSSLLPRLLKWSPVPVHFLHCVRNPYDITATRHHQMGLTMLDSLHWTLEREQTTRQIADAVGPGRFWRIHLEDLIAEPERELRALLNFLDLAPTPGWLEACTKLLWKTPRQTRSDAPWTAELIAEADQLIAKLPHLQRYRATRDELHAMLESC